MRFLNKNRLGGILNRKMGVNLSLLMGNSIVKDMKITRQNNCEIPQNYDTIS